MSAETPERRPPVRRTSPLRPTSSMWFMAGLIGLFLVLSLVSNTLRDGEVLQYSQFKTLVSQGRIVELTISTDMVRGKYQDPNNHPVQFSTARLDDPKLVEQLEEKGVRFSGEPQSHWPEILSWVLPIAIIVVIWS